MPDTTSTPQPVSPARPPAGTRDGRSAILSAIDGIRMVDLASRTVPRASRLIHPASLGTLTRIALSSDGRSLYFLRNVTESDIWVGRFR
jgi:hypothetical protein